ncbi:MAG: hypothetical protein GC159_00100 [Phycisphaera sp.]|nr:hypothetical protein [Phycisphaera sp.]
MAKRNLPTLLEPYGKGHREFPIDKHYREMFREVYRFPDWDLNALRSMIVDHDLDIDAHYLDGRSLMWDHVDRRECRTDLDFVQGMLSLGSSPNDFNHPLTRGFAKNSQLGHRQGRAYGLRAVHLKGKPAYFAGISSGRPDVVEAFLNAGADINAVDDHGDNAVVYALRLARDLSPQWRDRVYQQKLEGWERISLVDPVRVVELVMAAGADPTVRDNRGLCALCLAAEGLALAGDEIVAPPAGTNAGNETPKQRLQRRMAPMREVLVRYGYADLRPYVGGADLAVVMPLLPDWTKKGAPLGPALPPRNWLDDIENGCLQKNDEDDSPIPGVVADSPEVAEWMRYWDDKDQRTAAGQRLDAFDCGWDFDDDSAFSAAIDPAPPRVGDVVRVWGSATAGEIIQGNDGRVFDADVQFRFVHADDAAAPWQSMRIVGTTQEPDSGLGALWYTIYKGTLRWPADAVDVRFRIKWGRKKAREVGWSVAVAPEA